MYEKNKKGLNILFPILVVHHEKNVLKIRYHLIINTESILNVFCSFVIKAANRTGEIVKQYVV